MFKSKIIKLLKVQIAKMLIVKIIEFLALGISNQSYLLLGEAVQVYYLYLCYPQNWAFFCPRY